MLRFQHGHYRPDAVVRSSVIEPYDLQRFNPVLVARHTIYPFVEGVRPFGPMTGPTSTQIAQAAQAVAHQWAQGQHAVITTSSGSQAVGPSSPPPAGPAGQVVQVAQAIYGSQAPVVVQAPGSPPVVAHPPASVMAMPPQSASPQSSNTGAQVTATPPTTVGPPPSNVVRQPIVTGSGSTTATLSPGQAATPSPGPSPTALHTMPSRPATGPRLVNRPAAPAGPRLVNRPTRVGFGNAAPQPPMAPAPSASGLSPFHVEIRRAMVAQGKGISPSWYSAGRAAAQHTAHAIFPPGYAPVMPAGQWARENAAVDPVQQLIALWAQQ